VVFLVSRDMDTAVALVQSYLYMNGFFTVTEYPVWETMDDGEIRTVTDVDMLAVRFPGAGRVDPSDHERQGVVRPDPALDVDPDRIELIIAEVKEGRAELNQAARSREVLHAALHRFGYVAEDEADELMAQLLAGGEAIHPNGVRVRLMSFGSRPPHESSPAHQWLLMGQIVTYIRKALTENWFAARALQSKDPVISQMILVEKAIRGET